MFGTQCDTNRTAGINFDKPYAERRFQPIDNALGQALQHFAVGLLGQHQEFISPQPGQGLVVIQTAEHRQRHLYQ
ncbi:hypothetical protein D3C80_2077840 [compost metagenome]